METFEVIRPGMLTTVQDSGRHGYQKFGLTVSGASDPYAYRIANLLVGNVQSAAALEVTLMGLELKVLRPTIIAVTGADLDARVNGKPIPMWATVKAESGDTIKFSGCRSGCRSYLAVTGGIDVPVVLGSRSTDTVGLIGGMDGRPLKKGDRLRTGDATVQEDELLRRRVHPGLIPEYPDQLDVRVILGPQEDAFTEQGLETFFTSTYKVSKDSDRMGCRLEGPKIEHVDDAGIISEGLFTGAVQVPQNGMPIVFLTGRPSVGGYTKIGGVISVDIPRLAQVKPGNTIRFHPCSLEEAHQLMREYERIFSVTKVWNRAIKR